MAESEHIVAPEGPSLAVVDGDAAVRDSFFALLGGAGFVVHTYASGLSFLKALPTIPTNCALVGTHLVDLGVEGMVSGIKEAGGNVPTIVVANHPREILGLSDLTDFVVGQLFKPVEESALFAAIDDALHCGGSFDGR